MVARANAVVWAHELGHQLGARDIYDCDDNGSSVISVSFGYDHADMDWSNGCIRFGAGYYTRNITCDQIIARLLMNGETDLAAAGNKDITAGSVYGVVVDGDGNASVDDANIGLLNK